MFLDELLFFLTCQVVHEKQCVEGALLFPFCALALQKRFPRLFHPFHLVGPGGPGTRVEVNVNALASRGTTEWVASQNDRTA